MIYNLASTSQLIWFELCLSAQPLTNVLISWCARTEKIRCGSYRLIVATGDRYPPRHPWTRSRHRGIVQLVQGLVSLRQQTGVLLWMLWKHYKLRRVKRNHWEPVWRAFWHLRNTLRAAFHASSLHRNAQTWNSARLSSKMSQHKTTVVPWIGEIYVV